jgi:hypothetical protein
MHRERLRHVFDAETTEVAENVQAFSRERPRGGALDSRQPGG